MADGDLRQARIRIGGKLRTQHRLDALVDAFQQPLSMAMPTRAETTHLDADLMFVDPVSELLP